MEENKRHKINMKSIGLCLIGVIVILFLVSRTIYTYRLPVVTATTPFNGKLSKTEKTKGYADWESIMDIYADIGGKVEAVYVKEGQRVEKGEALFSLSFDENEIRQALKALTVSRNSKTTQISSLQLQINANNRRIGDLQNEEYIGEHISDFDIRQLQRDIDTKTADLEKLEALYEAGAVTRSEYETAKNSLQAVTEQKKEMEKIHAETLTKQAQSKTDGEKSRQKQIQDYLAANEGLKKDIEQAQHELKSYDIQQETYEGQLEKFGDNATIYAGETGILFTFNINRGQHIADGFYSLQLVFRQ